MLKITLEVKENNDSDTCKVNIQTPKDITKGTENEQKVTAIVIDKINKALAEIAS